MKMGRSYSLCNENRSEWLGVDFFYNENGSRVARNGFLYCENGSGVGFYTMKKGQCGSNGIFIL